VPEVLADQHPQPPEARVKGPDAIPPGEVAPLVKQGVGRQVDLVVQVDDLPAGEIRRRHVEAVAGVLVDEADHQIQVAAGLEQDAEGRVVGGGAHRHLVDQVLQVVAGQGKLREQQQINAGGPGPVDVLQVPGQVGRDVADGRVNLGDAHRDLHKLPTSRKC